METVPSRHCQTCPAKALNRAEDAPFGSSAWTVVRRGYVKQRRGRWDEMAELYLQYLTKEVRTVRGARVLWRGPLQQEDKKRQLTSQRLWDKMGKHNFPESFQKRGPVL